MPTDVAMNFTNSLLNFLAGNQGLVNAFTFIKNLNVDTVTGQQNNTAGKYKTLFRRTIGKFNLHI